MAAEQQQDNTLEELGTEAERTERARQRIQALKMLVQIEHLRTDIYDCAAWVIALIECAGAMIRVSPIGDEQKQAVIKDTVALLQSAATRTTAPQSLPSPGYPQTMH